MNQPIQYINRTTGLLCEEQVYFEKWLNFFYGKNPFGRLLGNTFARFSLFSKLAGFLQSLPSSRRKIAPFIERYGIDSNEMLHSIETFRSFNDFFTRKLKPEARPLDTSDLIIPADGRYLLYSDINETDGFIVKGEKFSLANFLGSDTLASRYAHGSMLIARLCPTDYHRFHFPCDGVPGHSRLINGYLHSVSPIALRKNIHYLTENKRIVTTYKTKQFGDILLCEVGATNVGSIQQTYEAHKPYLKGDEKGFFSFGGSTLVLLFEPGNIKFSEDLRLHSLQHVETLCLVGQALGNIK